MQPAGIIGAQRNIPPYQNPHFVRRSIQIACFITIRVIGISGYAGGPLLIAPVAGI